jgi:beta-glucosidase
MTRHFADVVRQEYEAVGIRESLAPQADLATEPRWARINGTFGEDAEIAKRMVEAYVAGLQNDANGLNSGSVIAVVKHWTGYGAAKDGWDGHNYYGRYAEFAGHNFAQSGSVYRRIRCSGGRSDAHLLDLAGRDA